MPIPEIVYSYFSGFSPSFSFNWVWMIICFTDVIWFSVLNTKCNVWVLLLLSTAAAVVFPPEDMFVDEIVVLFLILVPDASSVFRFVSRCKFLISI